jgi:hypothetical protein
MYGVVSSFLLFSHTKGTHSGAAMALDSCWIFFIVAIKLVFVSSDSHHQATV